MSEQTVSLRDALQRALAHQQAGRLAEAAALYERILAAAPDHPPALHLAGVLAFQQGDAALAVQRIARALTLAPGDVRARYNLGVALAALGRDAEAVEAFRAVHAAEPTGSQALAGLAPALRRLGRTAEAAEVLTRWLALEPESADAHAQYGHLLQARGDLDEAVQHYRRAVAVRPDHADAWNNLGMALLHLGAPGQAIAAFRRAHALQPGQAAIHSNLLYALTLDPACTPEAYRDEAHAFGAAVSAGVRPWQDWPAGRPGTPIGTLCVGVVSGDLGSHPVGYFLESVVACSDPARLSWHAYETRARNDAVTDRLRSAFAGWRVIAGLTDAEAAAQIRADGIHVLLDLAGHTAWNRLSLFAWCPAPVQAAWMGYSATTGVPAVRWMLVDRASVPPATTDLYSERPWYLPETRVCLTPPTAPDALLPSPLPARAAGYVTFGSFQALTKLGDPVLALWAQVLAAVPGSRLRIQNKELSTPAHRDAFRERLAAAGLDPARVQLAGWAPREAYLAAHAEVDFVLDSFPYPGGTTTCESLWMGVPTLTLEGRTMLSRYGAAVLSAAGLDDWVARDMDHYVELAQRHAADLQGLAALRATLRGRLQQTALFDARRFADGFADALHSLWLTGERPGA